MPQNPLMLLDHNAWDCCGYTPTTRTVILELHMVLTRNGCEQVEIKDLDIFARSVVGVTSEQFVEAVEENDSRYIWMVRDGDAYTIGLGTVLFHSVRGKVKRDTGTRQVRKEDRKEVLAIGRCLVCGTDRKLTVDHVWPLSKGGSNHRRNLQCLCQSCNSRKGARHVVVKPRS